MTSFIVSSLVFLTSIAAPTAFAENRVGEKIFRCVRVEEDTSNHPCGQPNPVELTMRISPSSTSHPTTGILLMEGTYTLKFEHQRCFPVLIVSHGTVRGTWDEQGGHQYLDYYLRLYSRNQPDQRYAMFAFNEPHPLSRHDGFLSANDGTNSHRVAGSFKCTELSPAPSP